MFEMILRVCHSMACEKKFSNFVNNINGDSGFRPIFVHPNLRVLFVDLFFMLTFPFLFIDVNKNAILKISSILRATFENNFRKTIIIITQSVLEECINLKN